MNRLKELEWPGQSVWSDCTCRYLHSLGQIHKGGTNVDLFMQLTVDETHDLPVPDQPSSFCTLKHIS